MSTRAEGESEITNWDGQPYDEREGVEEYVQGDSFSLNGMMS